ncbi:alpha/beta family hydrolase [Roseateles cellulosilyticus]|uniref:Alpha/beta hydrolase n=1 Tax=Pelomonas cellulosilytica TaxID=2906762 RepID=A0ABS8Y0Y6_9BURK|nr:alpha/beta family hydrolase [Pelomonas sp. P8]MCE4555375.1 alpha/beta hydrolase [Pelomonas sp. P8]
MNAPKPFSLTVDAATVVSALWWQPPRPHAVYVFAHGAGAGMQHSFMDALSQALSAQSIATLRYQFPYMERGSKRPDSPAVAHAAVRAAVAEAHRCLPDVPLLAGGKSFGGRMTSQAQAAEAMPGVHGLVFVGFPLHPAGKPGVERAAHLADVDVPILFLQGTRDELADLALLRGVVAGLGAKATLQLEDDADHAFHVRARSGRNDAQVVQSLASGLASWLPRIARWCVTKQRLS